MPNGIPSEVDDRIKAFRAMVTCLSAHGGGSNEDDDEAVAVGPLVHTAHASAEQGATVPALLPRHPKLTDKAQLFTTQVRKSSSLLDKCGVRVHDYRLNKHGEERKVVVWFCLVGDCAHGSDGHCQTQLTITQKTTNHGCEHLSSVHDIVSAKTQSMKKNLQNHEAMIANASEGYKHNAARFFQINFGVWAAIYGISFSAFKNNDTWAVIAGHLPTGSASLRNLDVSKSQVEQYVHMKALVCDQLHKARSQFFGLAFLCLNLDLYQSKLSGDKYVGLRVSWSWASMLFSRNLSMRCYNPTFAERTDTTQTATELLYNWSMGVLAEFGINEKTDILTGSGDGGSDVKRLMEKEMIAKREWCVSHLLNLGMVDAFGTNIHNTQCKNREARVLFKLIRKMVETVNKSNALKTKFEENQKAAGLTTIKVANAPQHRWGSVEDTLRTSLSRWTQLQNAFAESGKDFSVAGLKKVYIEFYSVIHAVRDVQRTSQCMKEFVALLVYMEMASLHCDLLDESQPLEISDPSLPLPTVQEALMMRGQEQQGQPKKEHRPAIELDPRTTVVRTKLRKALYGRWYDRYHAIRAVKKEYLAGFYFTDGTRERNKITLETVELDMFVKDYVFELISLLLPREKDALGTLGYLVESNRLLADEYKVLHSSWRNVARIKARFFEYLSCALWKELSGMVTKAAMKIQRKKKKNRAPTSAALQQSDKRVRLDKTSKFRALAGFNATLSPTEEVNHQPDQAEEDDLSPQQYGESELARYRESPLTLEEHDIDYSTLFGWWGRKEQKQNYPCLALVSSQLFGFKPGSGGLECDIGGMGDVISPKRSSLSPGMVEVAMFLKLNKDLVERDPLKVTELSRNDWKHSIPGRPEYPHGYFIEDNEDEEDSIINSGHEDNGEDSDSSLDN